MFILLRLFYDLIMRIPIVNTFFAVVFLCFAITLPVIITINYFSEFFASMMVVVGLLPILLVLLIIFIYFIQGVIACLLYVLVILWDYICNLR